MKTNIHFETITWSRIYSNHSASHSFEYQPRGARSFDHQGSYVAYWVPSVSKICKVRALFLKRCILQKLFELHKNRIHFYINDIHFYKNCVYFTTTQCLLCYKNVCVLFFKHTYKVVLRFRPSNIKMLSTRLIYIYMCVYNHTNSLDYILAIMNCVPLKANRKIVAIVAFW